MNKGRDIIELPGWRLDFSQGCILMGVLNVTPDSFSDGGEFFDKQKAIERGVEMAQEGAAIIDVGAESTRPGAKPVNAQEQIKRAIPVIEKLREKIDVPISIDTSNYKVVKAAIEAGAGIVNDITAVEDERIGKLAAEKKLGVILMHMKGEPATMQIEPKYEDVVGEVLKFLIERAERAKKLGVAKERIFIDPGIGFGKTAEHNIEILKNLRMFVETGYRVVVGTSRKNFIGKLTGKDQPHERVFGTAGTVALCAQAGVSIVRVHDVKEMADVVKVVNAIERRT